MQRLINLLEEKALWLYIGFVVALAVNFVQVDECSNGPRFFCIVAESIIGAISALIVILIVEYFFDLENFNLKVALSGIAGSQGRRMLDFAYKKLTRQ